MVGGIEAHRYFLSISLLEKVSLTSHLLSTGDTSKLLTSQEKSWHQRTSEEVYRRGGALHCEPHQWSVSYNHFSWLKIMGYKELVLFSVYQFSILLWPLFGDNLCPWCETSIAKDLTNLHVHHLIHDHQELDCVYWGTECQSYFCLTRCSYSWEELMPSKPPTWYWFVTCITCISSHSVSLCNTSSYTWLLYFFVLWS